MNQIVYCERTESGATNIKAIQEAISSFPVGKRLEVSIKPKSNRSTRQNSWLWACTTILSKELGYEKDKMHEIIKFKFLKREIVTDQGEVLEWIDSTAKLSKEDFAEFMEGLIRWSIQTFNVSLPYPDEQLNVL